MGIQRGVKKFNWGWLLFAWIGRCDSHFIPTAGVPSGSVHSRSGWHQCASGYEVWTRLHRVMARAWSLLCTLLGQEWSPFQWLDQWGVWCRKPTATWQWFATEFVLQDVYPGRYDGRLHIRSDVETDICQSACNERWQIGLISVIKIRTTSIVTSQPWMVEVSLWLEFIRVVVAELLAAMYGIGRNNYRSVLGDEHSLIPVIFGDAMRYTQWQSMKWISFLNLPI